MKWFSQPHTSAATTGFTGLIGYSLGAWRLNNTGKWQGRLDLNQRMAGSKPAALPLGDAPVSVAKSALHSV
jgi:hypothetical protein